MIIHVCSIFCLHFHTAGGCPSSLSVLWYGGGQKVSAHAPIISPAIVMFSLAAAVIISLARQWTVGDRCECEAEEE